MSGYLEAETEGSRFGGQAGLPVFWACSMRSLIRSASPLRCPWLARGSPPPVDSMRRSDQNRPEWMRTLATRIKGMDISLRENQERFRRVTAVADTSIWVGKSRFPWVQRLAGKVSVGMGQV